MSMGEKSFCTSRMKPLSLGQRLLMALHLHIQRRRSIRLRGYDYSSDGWYFVTICTYNRGCIFGDVVKEKMELHDVGKVVEEEWLRTREIRANVELDMFVVMPNHVHGIIVIKNDVVGATRRVAPTRGTHPTLQSGSLGAIIGQFKSVSAKRINKIRHAPGAPLWQRGYYEHIVRNENDLNRLRRYIAENPARWFYDEENPRNKNSDGPPP